MWKQDAAAGCVHAEVMRTSQETCCLMHALDAVAPHVLIAYVLCV